LPASLIRLGGREFSFPPFSPTALGIIEAGGLVQHIRRKLGLPERIVMERYRGERGRFK